MRVTPQPCDAAVRCDRADESVDLLARLEPSPSPVFRFGHRYARALLGPSDEAFTSALDTR